MIRAAGGVVWRRDPSGAVEVVLVHRPRYDDWTLPKGKLDAGESEEDGALREVEEETGLRCRLGRGLGTTSYRDSQGREKVVRYWEMTPEGGDFRPTEEVDAVRWLPLGEAARALSYGRDRDVLARFGGAPAVPVRVVRHAKAVNRRRWTEPDDLRPLSKAGRRQARGLVDQLDGEPLARLVSSPAVRCVQTLEPLAAARGVPLEVADALAEGEAADDALALVRAAAADGPAALCTHGDVLELVVHQLVAAGVPLTGGGLFDLAKGSTWVLEVSAGAIGAARYVRPPTA